MSQESLLSPPAAAAATPAPASPVAATAPTPSTASETPPPAAVSTLSPPAAVLPPGHAQTPTAFLGEGMTMHFEGLAPFMEPDHRAAIDGLKARFDGKPITEFVTSYREAEKALTELRQSAAAPPEPTLQAYGITQPEGLDDQTWAAESAKAQEFIKDAHAAGVTKAGFQSLYNRYLQTEQAAQQDRDTASREAKTAAQQALAKEWGAEYPAKLETTNQTFAAALQELNIERADNPDVIALENNPVFIRYAHQMAVKLAEASGQVEGTTTMPRSAVATQLSGPELAMDIMSNPANPLHAKFLEQSKSGGGDVIDHVQKLRAKMKPLPPALR